MTRYRLRIAHWTLRFNLESVLAVIALLGAAWLLSSFVGTLHDSIHRGELLRQSQQAAAEPLSSCGAAPTVAACR